MALASWEAWWLARGHDSGTITLDTAPPQGILTLVEATAGQVARVAYVLDEPAAISAVLHLEDDRELPMTVTGTAAGELAVDLPADAPASGEVRLLVRDELDNEATLTLTIAIAGSVTPTVEPSGGMPDRMVMGARIVRSHARARVRMRVHQAVSTTTRAGARVVVSYGVTVFAPPVPPRPTPTPAVDPSGRRLVTVTSIRVRSDVRINVLSGTGTLVTTYGRWTTRRTKDERVDPRVLELLDVL